LFLISCPNFDVHLKYRNIIFNYKPTYFYYVTVRNKQLKGFNDVNNYKLLNDLQIIHKNKNT